MRIARTRRRPRDGERVQERPHHALVEDVLQSPVLCRGSGDDSFGSFVSAAPPSGCPVPGPFRRVLRLEFDILGDWPLVNFSIFSNGAFRAMIDITSAVFTFVSSRPSIETI